MQSITKNSDISSIILKYVSEKQIFKIKDIVKVTGLSQPYINRIVNILIENGLLVKSGNGKNTIYTKPGYNLSKDTDKIKLRFINKGLSESDVLEDINRRTSIFNSSKKNVQSIAEYAFNEMLNNAIEHSNGENITISAERANGIIRFDITDNGIGIFNNLAKKFKLKNEIEAVQELLKGKKTTFPAAHSGEGIFFTSKASDTFIIQSSGKKLFVNNLINDLILTNSKVNTGTKVTFTLSEKSVKELNKIFDEYTDEDFEFNKTKIHVKLYKHGTEYLSRSQARRILAGLEKFKFILLDFKDVIEAGQAFSDEIFRVFKNSNPDKKIEYINANDNVEFMIKRALANDIWK
ncbi:MAG: DUF4325 domain-containing protein [Ignavibacteria bacterium]|nr:DUF4325 domain-containing protein [Ignavibacteria bacterium]